MMISLKKSNDLDSERTVQEKGKGKQNNRSVKEVEHVAERERNLIERLQIDLLHPVLDAE